MSEDIELYVYYLEVSGAWIQQGRELSAVYREPNDAMLTRHAIKERDQEQVHVKKIKMQKDQKGNFNCKHIFL